MIKNSLAMLALGGMAILATVDPTAAQELTTGKHAGDIMLRVRGLGVIPEPSSSISAIGGHIAASDTAVPEIDGTYFFTDNIAAELIAATTRHHITAKGTTLGDVDVGKVRLLPPTLTGQYHFMPQERFSPYLGTGINYTWFFDTLVPGNPVSSVSYSNGFGAVIQAGFDYNLAGNWYLNFDVKQIFLNTTAKLNGGAIRADVDLNPTLISLGVGYKF
jgi:outer membrane protein